MYSAVFSITFKTLRWSPWYDRRSMRMCRIKRQ